MLQLNPQNTNLNTVGAGLLAAAALLGLFISRGGTQSGGFTDTTDTAANIIARGGLNVGASFTVEYVNTTGQTATLAGGTGVTFVDSTRYGATKTVATLVKAAILFTVTSASTMSAQILAKSTTV